MVSMGIWAPLKIYELYSVLTLSRREHGVDGDLRSVEVSKYSHSPDVNMVSMGICAPLKKSPNWASQMQRRFGDSMLTPYSNASIASSVSALFTTCGVKP